MQYLLVDIANCLGIDMQTLTQSGDEELFFVVLET